MQNDMSSVMYIEKFFVAEITLILSSSFTLRALPPDMYKETPIASKVEAFTDVSHSWEISFILISDRKKSNDKV